MNSTKQLGIDGENAVCQWLEQHGFILLERNYLTRTGEVDIIASKDDTVAFVEVKTRHDHYFPLAQTVTWRKQQRIIKAAQHFILSKGFVDKVFRFDVATVLVENNSYHIEYIPNAFQRA